MSEAHAMSNAFESRREITPKPNQTNKFCAHELTGNYPIQKEFILCRDSHATRVITISGINALSIEYDLNILRFHYILLITANTKTDSFFSFYCVSLLFTVRFFRKKTRA